LIIIDIVSSIGLILVVVKFHWKSVVFDSMVNMLRILLQKIFYNRTISFIISIYIVYSGVILEYKK